MRARRVALVVACGALLGGALAAGLALWLAPRRAALVGTAEDVPPTRASTPAPVRAPDAEAQRAPEVSVPLPEGEVLDDFRSAARPGEDAEALAALPTEIDYPRFDKYADASFSAVPHQLVAAWDDRPDDAAYGPRRMFIAVVDPATDDPALEALLRDVRDRHRDAEHLAVRVFDSAEAARRPSWTDQGRTRDAHLVAELRRDVANGREWLRVRGREIEP